MYKSLRLLSVLCIFFAPAFSFSTQAQTASASVSMPLAFEINHGQTAPQVRFLARSREGVLFFTSDGVTVAVPHQGSFRLLFENASVLRDNAIIPEEQLIARSNYLNREPAVVNVENFAALRYAAVYPGIDVRFYGNSRHLEHDFILAPGADPGRILLRAEGLDSIRLRTEGDVELMLGKMKLFESAPVAWQTIKGKRVRVEAAWKLVGADRLGITLGDYDRNLPVTIDPVLAYATLLGGNSGQDINTGGTFSADTTIEHIALDANLNIYVSGTTSAVDYPTTAGAFDRSANTQDVFHEDATTQSGFVSKFDKTGRILIYSTFLNVDVQAMAVDPSGHVYAAEAQFIEDPGPNFGFDEGINIAKLSLDGSRLLYSKQFAQTTSSSSSCQAFSSSFPGGLAADGFGHLWLTGSTANPCLPATAGAFQTKLPYDDGAAFVAKFDTTKPSASSVVFATYLGGSDSTSGANEIAIDSSGNAYIAGTTGATNFPHGAAFGSGAGTAFVTKLNATGSGLAFSTLLHGVDGFPAIGGIGIDSSHNVYVTGSTSISTFPTTTGAFRRTIAGGRDVFVTKLSSGGGTLLYSTFLGGSVDEVATGLHLNSARMAFVTGSTTSGNFPTTANAFRRSLAPATQDAFVTALQPDGKSLVYSTFLGGSNTSAGEDIWVDPAWNAWVVGNTSAPDFPVTRNAFQPGLKGHSDAFIAKVVIAADLALLSPTAPATTSPGQTITYHLFIGNQGPDNSDNLVITDTLASGTSIVSSSLTGGTGPTSCSVPLSTDNGGIITCKWRGLIAHETIDVTIKVKVNAPAGTKLFNTFKVRAQTQDLNLSNNTHTFITTVQ